MNKRLPQVLKDIEGLIYLNTEDLLTIEQAASAMTLEDCFDLLMVDKAEVPKYDMHVATAVHKRGRTKGIQDAVSKLFVHMGTRTGGASSIEYLNQMSGEFQVEATRTPGTGFAFNVVIPEEK